MATLISEAIEKYHELLSTNLDSTVSGLADATRDFNLTVKDRPVCNVLRPLFLDQNTYDSIRTASASIMLAFRTLSDRLMTDTSLRKQLLLPDEVEEAIQIDTGFGPADVSARLDGFLGPEGTFYFVEYNADSPGGIGFGDVLAETFLSFPIFKEFSKTFHTQAVPVREKTFEALMNSYQRWGGKDIPVIAIVDWREAVTFNEFVIMKDYFQKRGCTAIIADPAELELRNGILYAAGQPVQLVYKRVVASELIERGGLNHPLVQAAKTRAVCMANGLAVQMLFNKMLFAFLSDPSYQAVQPELRQSVDRYIPWTRLVCECNTIYTGKTVDLLPFVAENRKQLVLKPVSEYGGRGVVLGWECNQEDWTRALQLALKTPHVVQERVPVGSELYPSFVDGHLSLDSRFFDLDPYVWQGINAEGCGVRLSRAALLNVSGGGSATPMLLISKL